MTRSKTRLLVLCVVAACAVVVAFWMFPNSAPKGKAQSSLATILTDSLSRIAGVAVIVNDAETITVNNRSVYPMMSVFKVHQALALCDDFDRRGLSLDTLIRINRSELDPKTWSPMMKDHPERILSLTIRDLLRYTLTQSDNNASNLLFKRLVDVAKTDSFVATIIPRSPIRRRRWPSTTTGLIPITPHPLARRC